MKYNAVIFDMDGLLIDSENLARRVFVEACRENNFEPDIEIYNRCIGTTTHTAARILQDGYGETFPYQAVSELWETKYLTEVMHTPVPLKPGVLELLQFLEEEGVKKAIVTSTDWELAATKLTNAGLIHYFDFILGRDQVVHGKPDPEIYLLACRELGERPEDCLALEDSNNGVMAAYKAGVTVFQIPDLVEPSVEIKNIGHPILKSLSEVKKYWKHQNCV